MFDLRARLDRSLQGPAAEWFATAEARLAEDPARHLPTLLPALARRVGRTPFGGGQRALTPLGEADETARVDLERWRLCDVAGLFLIAAASLGDDGLVDLYRHGDREERTIVLRAQHLLPIRRATIELLGEAQRTNDVDHFEAAVCDGDVVARALGRFGFEQADLDRIALKLAFLDLPLDRMPGLLEHVDTELSRMVEDLAREREAAGRKVWADTVRVQVHAPLPDTAARLRATLDHPETEARRAAARALTDPAARPLLDAVRDMARSRLEQEPDELVRASLQAALTD